MRRGCGSAGEHGVPPELGPKALRRNFGLEFHRKVDKNGLRFLALQFNSPRVQSHFGEKLLFRVNRFDLSEISVWDGKEWFDVPATLDVPRGMTMYEWAHVGALHEAEFAGDSDLHLDWVLDAMNEIRRSGKAADLMSGINPLWNRLEDRAWANRLDRERFHGVRVVATSEEHPGLLDLTASRASPEAEPCELPPLHHWDDEPVAADEERYAIPGEDKKPDAEDTAMAAEFIDDEWSENDDDSDDDDDDVEIWIE